MDPRSNGRPPNAAAVPKSAVSAPAQGQARGGGGGGKHVFPTKLGVLSVIQERESLSQSPGAGKGSGSARWGLCSMSPLEGELLPLPPQAGRPPPRPRLPHEGPPRCPRSHRPLVPLQKYIAQVLQDSEVDGDGGPGSSGDEPPSSSSQDEELLMQPDGLTDTDFQSCEDSLIENEIRQ